MLTTSIDGLWVLQVLTGIEVVAPELGLRPHLPSIEKPEVALAHPVAAELRQAAVLDRAGDVDPVITEWLTVLARRDVALLMNAQTPLCATEPQRVLLARFSRWWVTLERYGDVVRLSAAGTATTERSAAQVVAGEIERLLGHLAPAELAPVTLDADELIAGVRGGVGLRRALDRQRLDEDQVRVLVLASDSELSAQLSIAAIQSGTEKSSARVHIDHGAVTVIDTPQGRVIVEHISRDGKTWMIVAPGSSPAVAAAMQKMLRRLPAQAEWHSYRKAV